MPETLTIAAMAAYAHPEDEALAQERCAADMRRLAAEHGMVLVTEPIFHALEHAVVTIGGEVFDTAVTEDPETGEMVKMPRYAMRGEALASG
jgi:hypothetical protein